MSSIEISNLTKSFVHDKSDNVVLDCLNLKVNKGEFLVVLGASGTGKSTLLRVISGLEIQDSGHVLFNDDIVDQVSVGHRNVGMVFQSYALYPHLTVFENIAFGIRYRANNNNRKDRLSVDDMAEALSLSKVLNYYPSQLSGGQRQRVAIGRALIAKPEILLFDEPLSNLDVSLRNKLRAQISKHHNAFQTTTIYITHDQKEAMALADRIAVLNKGKVEQVGAPQELYNAPKTRYIAGFLGESEMNFFDVAIDDNDNDCISVLLATKSIQTTISQEKSKRLESCLSITLGIRPEHILVDSEGELTGVIEALEYLGANYLAHIKLDSINAIVQVKVNSDKVLLLGTQISLTFLSEHIHLFDGDGISLYYS
jgi:ABC-type sugar transport system ATPase subunit